MIGREEEIYTTGNQYLRNLPLSPDGLWLTFSTVQGVEDLFVMRPDGSGRVNLTEDLHRDRVPTWYPDIGPDGGVWLTFASNRDGPQYQIYAIRPNGTESRQITDGYQSNTPAWIDGSRLSVMYQPMAGTSSKRTFEFPDGLLGESFGPAQGTNIGSGSVFSPNRQLIGQRIGIGTLRRLIVFSASSNRRISQTARDANGNQFVVPGQLGNRWLDDRRLIFWDLNSEKAYLWDVESETATEVPGLTEGEFIFSEDGKTIYILNTTVNSDIWLLQMSR